MSISVNTLKRTSAHKLFLSAIMFETTDIAFHEERMTTIMAFKYINYHIMQQLPRLNYCILESV